MTAHLFVPLDFPGSVWTDEPDPALAWYVVICNPKRERTAAIGLQRKGVAPYLPMELYHATINGRRGVKAKPLFPRYVFAAWPEEPRFRDLERLAGVESYMRTREGPSRMPTRQLLEVVEAEKAGAFDYTIRRDEPAFTPGQQVEIIKPFGTFVGTVLKAAPGERVTVLLAMMGRASKVQVEVSDVRAL